MIEVELDCGHCILFKLIEHPPGVGQIVPCVRHGYCAVAGTRRRRSTNKQPRRRPNRQLDDVRRYIGQNPAATPNDLRRARFSLRLIAQAEAEGVLSTSPNRSGDRT